LKAAREKAQDMAGAYGQTIGTTLQIVENGGYGLSYGGWNTWSSSRRDYGMSQFTANSGTIIPSGPSGEAGETVALGNLGKIGVRANVSVVFELKDK
jgi:hypothetical protein